ncbi:MAG TPA: SDR family oxidoreductase [Candidatus Methylomirabilis sp.]|jgi:UDP-glucose 4-epimerase
MTTYLVTGGAGFIGSNIAHELVRRGHRVRVLDNFATGRRANLTGIEDRVELIEGDLRLPADVEKAVEGVEVVLHQGALGSVPRSVADPLATHEANVTGTLHVLWASRAAGVRRVVYASSSSVYGDTPTLPKREDMPPAPLSPYAVSKLAGEHYCSVFAGVYGLETVSLRYFNVFGPRQDPASEYAAVIPKFIRAMRRGERPAIFGDGTQSRDFTYVENVVAANLLAAQAPAGALRGAVCNVACGEHSTLLDLVAALNGALGTRLEPIFRPRRPGDVLHSHAAIGRAEALLGYGPSVRFAEGIRRTVEWMQTHE